MVTKPRKTLTFDPDLEPLPVVETPNTIRATTTVLKQQVGARIPVNKYRQLKAKAALEGASVQELVEQAIDQFLAKQLG